MHYAEVAENVQALVNKLPSEEEFVYDFLLAYATPRASIARLRSGDMNLAKAITGQVMLQLSKSRK